VSRFHWRSVEEIPAIIDRCADLGFDTIYWQVRGGGAVLYRSTHEQIDARIASQLREAEPDPLAIAVAEARRRGVAIHAWMNCMTGWRGTAPPTDPAHPWNAHPAWYMVERASPPAARGLAPSEPRLSEGYVFMNPAVPEVRAHLAAMAQEIVSDYDVDGLVLDYIRYPGQSWSFDKTSLGRFGNEPSIDPVGWQQFRVAQIDATVEEIAAKVRAARPDVLLSAAVWGDAEMGERWFAQSPRRWLAEGWLDYTQPMVYVSDPAALARLVADHAYDTRARATAPALGIYLYPNSAPTLRRQVETMASLPVAGWSLYEYGSLADVDRADMATTARALLADVRPSFDWSWVARRVAGEADWVGPIVSETLSNSPLIKEGLPFRIGAKARDRSGIVVSEPATLRPVVESALTPDFAGAQRNDLVAMGDVISTAPLQVLVTPDAINAPSAEQDLYVRVVAHDRDGLDEGDATRVARGVGELKHFRPVRTRKEHINRGFFGKPIAGPQHPILAPGNRLWVVSELDACVRVFEQSGAESRFSPIRSGIDPDGALTYLRSPTSLSYDAASDTILLGEQRGDHTFLMRYAPDGTPRHAARLDVAGADFAIDAIGQLYVPEATRRRWHIFSQEGHHLGGPYSPFAKNDPRYDSPSLQHGIGVTPDGRRVMIACGTNGVVDVYELANAPDPDRIEGAIGLEEPEFTWLPEPLCRIGQGGAAIDIAPDGRIFVSDPDDRIHIFDATGQLKLLDFWSDSPPLRAPRGVAIFPPDGSAFFVAMHGMPDFRGQIQLWRVRSAEDPPLPENY
jgi:uncharacterized lipoprotein YddW (UPF0748 family)